MHQGWRVSSTLAVEDVSSRANADLPGREAELHADTLSRRKHPGEESEEAGARLAYELVGANRPRWDHLSSVGRCAEELAARSDLVTLDVVLAAWLHDVGYGPKVKASGFHPLDGARFLRDEVGVANEVVRLVEWHTGAAFAGWAGVGRADDDRPRSVADG